MSDEQNWFKAVLALKYTRDTLAPFVADEIEKRHQRILKELGVDVGNQRTCSLCTRYNLLPQWPCLQRSRYACFWSTSRYRRLCPNGICSKFYNLIVTDHLNRNPTWSNTKSTKWCSDYWEYAKCYIISTGYRDVHTAVDCDISALLSICITNRCIGDDSHIFEQCLVTCNEILHSISRKVTDKQRSDYIDQMICVLKHERLIGDAAEAVQRLQELKRHDYAMSKYEIAGVKDENLTDIKKKTTETLEMLHAKTMKILDREIQAVTSIKDNRTTTSSIPKKDTVTLTEESAYRLIQEAKRESGQQANVSEIRSCVETLLDKMEDIEVHQMGLGDSGDEEEYDFYKRVATQPFCDSFALTNVEEYTDSGIQDSRMSTPYPDNELSLVEEYIPSQARDCHPEIGLLHAEYDIEKSEGLDKKGLLSSIELNKLSSSEGRTSLNAKKECKKICAAIQAESDKIVHVFPAYKLNDEATIVFVAFAEKEITLHLPWTLEVRIVHRYSDESRIATYCEENSPLSTETSRTLGDIIDKYSVQLMRNHTYLSAISASSVVSKHYGTTNQNIAREPCIVLSVLIKHFIPINEEPFPTMLDGITVDVREGGVRFCGGSADDFHEQVRMGCKITSSFLPQKFGTLGGFVEHPGYGLCGFTCAHTILNDKKKLEVKGKGNVKGKDLGLCEIFQPFYAPQNKIGRVVEVTYKEGNDDKTGIDLALFKIEQRPPTEGNFPDNLGSTTPIKYESGKVWEKEGIPSNQPLVQKFGFATGLTHGQIQFDGAVVKEILFHSKMETDTVNLTTLYKQYHIKSNDMNLLFSDLGDSGALVFMSDVFDQEDNLRCIGMVEGIWNDNTCAVTPITAILEDLKITQLKSFTPNVTWKKIDARLSEMEERIMRAIARGKTNVQNPSQ